MREPANILDVARQAGVSKATVSRFLNGKGVRAPARARIEAAVRGLHYAPNRLAQSLKSGRSKTLGLVLPDIANPFFSEVVKGAEAAARDMGFHFMLAHTAEDSSQERDRLQMLKGLRVDGLLLIPAPRLEPEPHLEDALADLDVPVVFVDRSPGRAGDFVSADNALAGQEAARHLLSLRHPHIALLTADRAVSVHADRCAGFQRTLRAAGIAAAPVARAAPTVADGAAATALLLEQRPCPTAIFATSSRLAMGAVSAILARGLRCPEDVAVVGFDDFEWAAIFRPRLTTVAQPAQLIGQRAAHLLIERITGARRGPPVRVLLAPELVVRESCGVYVTARDRPTRRKTA